MSFVHLHVHTHYSLLDSTIRISALIERAKSLGMGAVALTDHDNMFGVVEFYKAAKKAGVKPILGCEVQVQAVDPEQGGDRRTYSLVLLAMNEAGYLRLIQMVSRAWVGRMEHRGRPIVTADLLSELSGDLIALSGGLGGEISQALLRNDTARAERVALRLKEIFGDRFHVEIQPPALQEIAAVSKELLALADRLAIPAVAASDCHYLERKDAPAHRALMCIQLGKSLPAAQGHVVDGFHMCTIEEMRGFFPDRPDLLENSLRIADMCDVELRLGEVHLPRYPIPEGHDGETDYLAFLAKSGLRDRIEALEAQGVEVDRARYETRLEYELGVIVQMGFAGYFLIVWDFIDWSRNNDVPVGPGRGSGAGSLVAYTLWITDIDPMKYDLLFERFLNPERVSMPDFDIDFCMLKRDRVIRYVMEKYGENNVGQIVTFGSLKARAVIRDVARVMEFSYGDADRVAKLVPDVLNISLEEALDQEPRLREAMEADEQVHQLIETARELENLYRHSGVHAAGIVIADDELWHHVPILTGEDGELVSQFAKNEVEEAGLVKFDFLGLKTLTVIDVAMSLVRSQQGADETPFEITNIPMDDPKVFALLSSGNTTGVFQLESGGFKDLMKRLRPDKFEDIIAAVALYRPGPLQSGMVDAFIRRKHGQERVDYIHPSLEDCLSETYGTIIYQEQVMRLASTLAGFSLGQADILRRAMGKKKLDVMEEQRAAFVSGAVANGIAQSQAVSVFDLVAEFASYGFNKSHSAAYGLISYQTAYLKAHHPVEFMAALLSCDRDNTDKVVRYIHEVRSMGLQILPPDVRFSDLDFSTDQGAIRFGLGAIKNVGAGAIESIIESRESGGPFESLYDFCERVDLRRVNRRVLEGLVKCGAFDGFPEERDVLFANIERAMDRGQSVQRDREAGQFNLFGTLEAATEAPESGSSGGGDMVVPEHEWAERELLAYERESLGFYITGHPLDRYADELRRYSTCTTANLVVDTGRTEVALGVVVAGMRERPLRDGSGRMAILQLEDQHGQMEAVCFSKEFAAYETLLKSDEPLLLKGTARMEGDGESKSLRLRVTEVSSILQTRRQNTRFVRIRVGGADVSEALVGELKDLFRQFPGGCSLGLDVLLDQSTEAQLACGEQWQIDPSDEMISCVERLLGENTVLLL